MKRIDPPFLELALYFADMHDTDAYTQLVLALLKLGAKFTGKAKVRKGSGARTSTFGSTREGASVESITLDLASLRDAWNI